MYSDKWFKVPEGLDLSIPMLQRNGVYSELFHIVELLNKLDSCNYFFSCGTALGVFRNGKLLDWDTDIDIDILEPTESLINDIMNEMQLLGYSFIRKLMSNDKYSQIVFVKKPYHSIDFCFWYKGKNNYINDLPETHIFKREHPILIYNFFKYIKIENVEFKIPGDFNSYFKLLYGDDWQAPRKYNNWLINANDLTLDFKLSRVWYKFVWKIKRFKRRFK
jgi:lipopolysaccharide cholinephosphotransferase